MQLFYAPEIEKNAQLPLEEAQHCFKVLRKTTGDLLTVIDGYGNFYKCEVLNHYYKDNSLKIIEKWSEEPRKNYIHIAIAPTKNTDRIEWFVEKAVEIGIDEITFLLCQNSERKVLKLDRISKIALSAAKQSIKASLPKINDLVLLDKFLKTPFSGQKLIAHLEENTKPIQEKTQIKSLVLIGPEGDFSKKEIELALNSGFESVSLGTSRLRTETAGVVACTLLNL